MLSIVKDSAQRLKKFIINFDIVLERDLFLLRYEK